VARPQDAAREATAVLADLQTAWQKQDVGKIMAAYSDDYSDASGGSISELRAFFDGLSEQGALQNTTMGIEKCEIEVDGDNATVGPVTYDSPTGGATYSYRLKREADGAWRIYNSELGAPTPLLVNREPIRVIGVPIKMAEGGDGGEWWDRYMERDKEIAPLSTDPAWYAVDFFPDQFDHLDGTHYIPGRAVSQDAVVPEGLIAYHVPGGVYAALRMSPDYEETMTSLVTWFGAEGYERDHDRPGIEYYAPVGGSITLIVPVKAKE